jgi:FRG domain
MTTSLDIRIQEVKSVANLLDLVGEQFAGNHEVLFRGHRTESWTLTPRIARAEAKMLAEFGRLAVPHLGSRPVYTPWDLLALAQHHGLPTRLLDWTSNPLVALWFAVQKPANAGASAAIWAYDIDTQDIVAPETSPFEQSKTMVFRPRHHDARIIAQAGWFTVHKYISSSERFSTLERIKVHRSELQKFIVPAQYFASLRDDGIHQASLFPDLSGLCGNLLWQYAMLKDEAT